LDSPVHLYGERILVPTAFSYLEQVVATHLLLIQTFFPTLSAVEEEFMRENVLIKSSKDIFLLCLYKKCLFLARFKWISL
jgi:hypothetical protein